MTSNCLTGDPLFSDFQRAFYRSTQRYANDGTRIHLSAPDILNALSYSAVTFEYRGTETEEMLMAEDDFDGLDERKLCKLTKEELIRTILQKRQQDALRSAVPTSESNTHIHRDATVARDYIAGSQYNLYTDGTYQGETPADESVAIAIYSRVFGGRTSGTRNQFC